MTVTVALLISAPRRDGSTLVAELVGRTLHKAIHKVKGEARLPPGKDAAFGGSRLTQW